MERLDNYSIALCLYLLKGNVLCINTTVFETLQDDLHHYFDSLRSYLGAEPALFKLERYNGHCNVLVEKARRKELKDLLAKYVDMLVIDKLTCRSNVLSWKNELKEFVARAKNSGYNLKTYNVTVDDMHVILYGFTQEKFELNKIDIIPDEVVPCFYDRDTSGDVENGDISKFHECLKVNCTIDLSACINNQDNEKRKYTLSGKTLWLYKYIRKNSYGIDCEISLEHLVGSKEDNKPYPTNSALKQALKRINDYYKDKYSTTILFVSKIKNGKTRFSCDIKYAQDDEQ